ncbi:MAG: hypothetical protein COC09_02530 [Gammaproteobacteria bacterium]|nr:MAG: hypothetical protein COC09_02530 [Gammaproteobacteria bacterium]
MEHLKTYRIFYANLINETAEYPRWNFHKYLVDCKGNIVASFESVVMPDDKIFMTHVKSLLQRLISSSCGVCQASKLEFKFCYHKLLAQYFMM